MLFRIAGLLSAAISALHVVIIFAGARAYRYFGAGEQMARMAERDWWRPAMLTALIALVFAVFAAYAFSAAGAIRKLPLLRTGNVVIGLIYTLRGLALFAQLSRGGRPAIFSAVSLAIGIVYLAAATRRTAGTISA